MPEQTDMDEAFLRRIQEEEVEKAVNDSAYAVRIMSRTLFAVHDKVKRIEVGVGEFQAHCHNVCGPTIHKRITDNATDIAHLRGMVTGTGAHEPVGQKPGWLSLLDWAGVCKVGILLVGAGLMIGGGIGACRYVERRGPPTTVTP